MFYISPKAKGVRSWTLVKEIRYFDPFFAAGAANDVRFQEKLCSYIHTNEYMTR